MKSRTFAFIDFMLKEQALDKFVNNLASMTDLNVTPDQAVAMCLREDTPPILVLGVIGGAFTWANTPEGKEYWQELEDKWIKHITPVLLEGIKRGE